RELRRKLLPMLLQADHLEVLVDGRRPLGLRHVAHAQREAHVLLGAEPRQERRARVLEEHDAILARAAHRRALEVHAAAARLLEAGEDIEQRRLAAARGAEQAEELALRDFEIDAVEREVALRVLAELLPDVSHREQSDSSPSSYPTIGKIMANIANIEVRSVDGLAGSAVPYAYAVKAGPWLFLTGHEAFDFAAGPAPEVEGPAGFPSFGAPRLKREAQYLLKRMRNTLAEFGSDFKSSVRVDQYYPVFEAVRAYQLARHSEFGDYIPPSTSVLMERLFKADSHISMSMIAVVPGKDYAIGKLYPKEVPVPVGSFFVPAITCNDFVFVAGQMASDENALDPAVRLPKELRNWGGPNAVRRQTEFIIKKRLEPALKAGDSSWQNVLKAQVYVPSAADIPDALDVWRSHVPY